MKPVPKQGSLGNATHYKFLLIKCRVSSNFEKSAIIDVIKLKYMNRSVLKMRLHFSVGFSCIDKRKTR